MRTRWVTRTSRVVVPVLFCAVVMVFGSASAASASTLTVCAHGCDYTQLAPAVAAAASGDVISVGPGTYAGGIIVPLSVTIRGAGAGATIISGGGPVVTIGTFGAPSEPTVTIEDVTITGGITETSPESTPFEGEAGVIAAGGGISIPPSADPSVVGATVTVANSVITGNRVAPTATVDGVPCPGLFDGYCPYAGAYGGGIDSFGNLKVANSTVSDNLIGTAANLSTVASDAAGGAIDSEQGSLTVTGSSIRDNSATTSGPDGRNVAGGGIYANGSRFIMSTSTVSGNTARLDASLPDSVVLSPASTVAAGGVFIEGTIVSTSVSNSIVSDNSVTMTNDVGSALAGAGGIREDVDVPLSNDIISGNSVTAEALAGASASSIAQGDSGAGHLFGTVSNSRLVDNTVTATALNGGSAVAAAGASLTSGSFENDVVSGNAISATSATGAPTVAGGGLLLGSLSGAPEGLLLQNTLVSSNTATTNGGQGQAVGFGGGIFDNPVPADGLPGGPLDLINSRVSGNSLTGLDATLLGGGVFALGESPTFTNSPVTGNLPDQCYGC